MRTAGAETASHGTKEEAEMPIVEVKIYDRRVTEESVPKIIEAMTAALAESSSRVLSPS